MAAALNTRRRLVGLLSLALAVVLVSAGCRTAKPDTTAISLATTPTTVDPADFTAEPTPPPPATTTTTTRVVDLPEATEADTELGRQFFESFETGDTDGWVSLMADDAEVVDGDERVGLFDPLPPDLGIPDWDGDGVVSVLDIIQQQSTFAVITGNKLSIDCSPDGGEVACTIDETDVFYSAAGIEAPTVVQRFVVRDGAIAEIGAVDVADPEAADAAFGVWLEQFRAFEEFVNDMHPDRFDALFTTPCCVGSPDTLNLVPANVDELAALLEEWSGGIR